MALARWKDLCVDVQAPAAVGPMWAELLHLTAAVGADGDGVLRGTQPGQTIWLNTVPETKSVKNRVHLDLVLPAYAPLITLGAAVLEDHEVDGRRWNVLADPEGNELCVFPPDPDRDWTSALVVDAVDAPAIAAWWGEVLDAQVTPGPDGALRWLREVPGLPYDVWKFVPVPEEKTVKNRWHWDVVCDDVDALVAQGAAVLRGPDEEVRWHVLADPEGNEFCAFAS